MNTYRNHYTHSAIIISLLLHGIFVFLLLSAIVVHMLNSNGKKIGRSRPAPVTMQLGDPAANSEQVSESIPDVQDEQEVEEIAPPPETVPHVLQIPDYASGKLAIPLEYIQPDTTEPVPTQVAMPVEVPQEVAPAKAVTPRRRRRKRKRISGVPNSAHMSPGQLMNAFNQSVRKSLDVPYGDPRGNAYGNSADGLTENQRYAVARANQMGDYRFKGRIDDVLERTFSIYAKDLNFEEDIETEVELEVLINPDGTISQVSFEKATNNKMVNDEIRRVLLKTENIPVPNRLSKEPYRHTIKGMARISKGKGKIRYIPKPKTKYNDLDI